MKHKKQLTEDEIREKVAYLRDQQNGLIEGKYSQYLVNIYEFLKRECDYSEDGTCNPYPWQVNDAAYPGEYKQNSHVGFEYCRDLEQLGYISISGSGADKKIRITKKLDFRKKEQPKCTN